MSSALWGQPMSVKPRLWEKGGERVTMEEVAAAIAETDSRSRANAHRLDKMERRQDDLDKLVTCVVGMQKDLEHTQADVREIKGNVKTILAVPGKNWNTLMTALITGLAGALVGAAITALLR